MRFKHKNAVAFVFVEVLRQRGERADDMENEDANRVLKSQLPLRRGAKAAFVISALKSLPSFDRDSPTKYKDEEMWRREIEDLKIELPKERMKNKKIKLCGSVEFIVQIMFFLLLLSFILMLVLKTLSSCLIRDSTFCCFTR